jgi:hypothetical protein
MIILRYCRRVTLITAICGGAAFVSMVAAPNASSLEAASATIALSICFVLYRFTLRTEELLRRSSHFQYAVAMKNGPWAEEEIAFLSEHWELLDDAALAQTPRPDDGQRL